MRRDVPQEALEHRIPGIARRESSHLVAGVPLERGAPLPIARGLAHQRRGQHPAGFDSGEVSRGRGATDVVDPLLRVAAPESDSCSATRLAT